MDTVFALIAVAANVLTAARLLCYRRGNSRYRFGMSFMAYLLIVCAGSAAIDTAVNGSQVTIWEAGFCVVIATLVVRARGNIAAVMRCV